MASRTIVTLVDDVDGSEASESITFAYRGVEYAIDLSESNAAALDESLSPWLQHAMRTGGRKDRSSSASNVTPISGDAALIRAWCAEQGIEVNQRGRIAAEIRDQYNNRDRIKGPVLAAAYEELKDEAVALVAEEAAQAAKPRAPRKPRIAKEA